MTIRSYDKHAGERLEAYVKERINNYALSKFNTYRNDISKRMKQEKLPKVYMFLVVNMFLI